MKRTLPYLLLSFCLIACAGAAFAQQSANPLVESLKSPNADIRAKAVEQLGNSGDTSTVPALVTALRDPSAKVRKEVIVALAKLHTLDSLHGLLTATKDSDPDVRALAVGAVVGWYMGNIPSLGFRGMVKRSYRNTLGWFQTDITHVNPGVHVDPQVISALETAMNDTQSIAAAREAAHGLGVLLARPAVPDLVKAAHSPDADLAVNALNALSKIKDVSAGPQLVDLLDSANKAVRQTACITVGILLTRSAVPKLEQIYQTDRDKNTRDAALDGLAFIGEPASYAVFVKALSSQDKTEREYGAEGLARARDPKALNDLNKRLSVEKDAGVKLAIQFALTSIGQMQHLQNLVDALSSRTRGEVAQSYLIELARRKNLLAALYSHLNDKDPTIRRHLCDVLMYSGDTSSIPYLQQLTRDRNSDVAAEAQRALHAIQARSGASAAA